MACWMSFSDAVHQLDDEVVEKILGDPVTAKLVSRYPGDFRQSVEIAGTGCFVNTNNNTNTKLDFMRKVSELVGIDPSGVAMKVRYPDT